MHCEDKIWKLHLASLTPNNTIDTRHRTMPITSFGYVINHGNSARWNTIPFIADTFWQIILQTFSHVCPTLVSFQASHGMRWGRKVCLQQTANISSLIYQPPKHEDKCVLCVHGRTEIYDLPWMRGFAGFCGFCFSSLDVEHWWQVYRASILRM